MAFTARVRPRGQITIPAKERNARGWDKGTVLQFQNLPDGKIGITPIGRVTITKM